MDDQKTLWKPTRQRIESEVAHIINQAYAIRIDDEWEGPGFGLFVENRRFGVYRLWSRF